MRVGLSTHLAFLLVFASSFLEARAESAPVGKTASDAVEFHDLTVRKPSGSPEAVRSTFRSYKFFPDYVPDSKAPRTRFTGMHGMPIDTPVAVNYGHDHLVIPEGYIWWGRYDRLPDTSNAPLRQIAFNFWMPSKRFVEVNPTSISSFQPREAGRNPPGPSEYIVQIRSMHVPCGLDKPFNENGSTLNVAIHFRLGDYDLKKDTLDLIKERMLFSRGSLAFDYYVRPSTTSVIVVTEKAEKPEFLMTCFPKDPSHGSVNSLCRGEAISENRCLELWMPYENIDEINLVIKSVGDLYRSWSKP